MGSRIEKHAENIPPEHPRRASGRPGAKPAWASGAKTTVGTAACTRSRIWFTVGSGTLNEIYFPDIDEANTRSIRFLVTNGKDYFSDEEHDATHRVWWPTPGVPSCVIECRCPDGRYRLRKEVITDPDRDTLLLRVQFFPTDQALRLFLHIEPHLDDKGEGNTAWISAYKGQPMLVAQRKTACLSVAATIPFPSSCAGFMGTSDGLRALRAWDELPSTNLAENGTVALTAELQLKPYSPNQDGESETAFTLAIACGADPSEAGQQARAGVLQDFGTVRDLFTQQWVRQQSQYRQVEDLSGGPIDMYRVSTAVLETHQSKRYAGAFVASLSLPWGFAHTDEDVGGYHVTWPRDMVETAMAKLASGDAQSARSSLFYLACTQNPDGGWSQNMWLDGSQHWGAVQMDGTALPILLADKLRRENSLDGYDTTGMVRQAASFLLKNGPVTQQGRWEAIAGYSPYTMATEVAALLAAADILESHGDSSESPGDSCAAFLRETADAWNDLIDEYTYVTGTPLAEQHGVPGYYIRMAPPKRGESERLGSLLVNLPNQRFGFHHHVASHILSPDALELVRFGLRAANDPRILATVQLIDATLRRETATGPGWTRSTWDGYGEHRDGAPFLKHGIGRCWPLLAGERAHYEIALGNHAGALDLLKTMSRQTSTCGMLPEQIWDAPDIPERWLFNGHPTGSGMPLVWAHSEYIKLLRSLHDGAVWDMPPQTVARYIEGRTTAGFQIWTTWQKRPTITAGEDLRLDLLHPAQVSWRLGKGGTVQEMRTTDSGLGVHCARLPTAGCAIGAELRIEVRYVPQGGSKPPRPLSVKVKVV